jgi:universal stress protein A
MKTQTLPARANPALFNIKRILVPLDFSPASTKALECAQRLAQELDSAVTLLHVVETNGLPALGPLDAAPSFSAEDSAHSEKTLRTLANSGNGRRPRMKWVLRSGVAAHEIVQAAKDLDADLIVIAAHGYTAWKHFCIGDTAERVVRAAPCAVLVVREKEHEFI